MKGDPEIITLGCRLNSYESALMRDLADGDTVIVNTCAVTAEAERQARQAIRKARRARPEARIIVTGCAAQIDPARYAAMPEVDRVLGNTEKLDARNFRADDGPRLRVNDIMAVRETAGHLVTGFEARARAFVQVQNGCDHRCTFCIIPYGRGPSRSVPPGAIVDQTRLLVERGYREIVLTGVDITAYGADLPGRQTLGGMVRRLLAAVPELPRLRLSSLDPVEIDDHLLGLIGDEARLMPHLHLSVQAGDDMILKRMKRRHGRDHVLRLCADLRRRRPDIVFGADLIAGFPTETDAMFENSLALVAEAPLTWLHVFPYSPRAGTPAARMPMVPAALRKARAARLRAAGAGQVRAFLAGQVGRRGVAIVEKPGLGRTEHFAMARFTGPAEPGSAVALRFTGSDGARLTGEPIAPPPPPSARRQGMR